MVILWIGLQAAGQLGEELGLDQGERALRRVGGTSIPVQGAS